MPNTTSTPEIKIDLDSIPADVQDRLAAGTLAFIRSLLADPVSRAALEARMAANRNAKA